MRAILSLLFLPFFQKQTPQSVQDICRNAKTKPKTLLIHADSKKLEVISALINNPNTPALALEKIADRKDYKLCLQIIQHKNVSNSTLEKLTQHWHQSVVRTSKEALISRGILNKYSIH